MVSPGHRLYLVNSPSAKIHLVSSWRRKKNISTPAAKIEQSQSIRSEEDLVSSVILHCYRVPSPLEPRITPNREDFVGKTGGQVFNEMMIRHKVRHIFGYLGGAILPVFDAIYNSKEFGFVLPRHEQGAGHMAQGYARATGEPGVVVVTSGPGATNLITPMMDALADGTPMVVFCGQVSTQAIGMDAFQEANVLAMSQPCTKWNTTVHDTSELPKRIDEAFEIPMSGRPGPVLVELPIDVTAALHIWQWVNSDETDPKALHMLGLHRSGFASMAIQHADLVIALGARFDDRVTGSIPKFAPEARLAASQGRGGIIHFDISPKNINKVVEATVPVIGDCAESLEFLLPQITKTQRPEWMAQITAWKEQYPFQAFNRSGRDDMILPQNVIERLSDAVDPIKDRTIITTGVGQYRMWTAQHFRWRHPRTLATSGGLGTMGYGLPAAIGAKVARPDALVIDIDGDASFNMTLSELGTASQFNIDVKVVLLNNEEQAMVTHLQTVYYDNRFCHSHNLNPDFVEAARAMGVQAESCSGVPDTDMKLKWLLESKGPALLEVKVAPKALSLPMVPSGRGLHEFQFYSD
ncbi:uncharacterized protein N7498_003135 [Penicillium cinerascens]|uniref:Acetolactate synthase n=1 Tax=Penicillium cinerascens TaxID=70096 RepID=A0A9W9T6U3_9EURO|nr:uncharacterized protein N7498_003135 [Penicillium cinerascens]KAJ5211489.1 hypothetical protein N7498_003135 [Penicillium cinerascens]